MRAYELRYLLIAAGSALLVACGGGGDAGTAGGTTASTTSSSSVDKYVGTWLLCEAEGAGSESESLVITKNSDTAFGFVFTLRAHAGTSCAGEGTTTEQGSGTGTLVGTKTIGSDTVDKIDITEGAGSEKIAAMIKDSRLVFSLDSDQAGYSADAEGYPNVMDEAGSYAKQ